MSFLINFDISLVLSLILTGFFIGIIASMVGIGGGLLMVPLLILVFSLDVPHASAASIVVIIFTSGSASYTNYTHRRIDIRTGLFFAILVVPFSFFGSWVGENLNGQLLIIIFGIFLLLVSLKRISSLLAQLSSKETQKKTFYMILYPKTKSNLEQINFLFFLKKLKQEK